MTLFEFIFILHMMKQLLGITNVLDQALQQQSQDIVKAIQLVASIKAIIQKLREDAWDFITNKEKSFCQQHHIDILDFGAPYTARRNRG